MILSIKGAADAMCWSYAVDMSRWWLSWSLLTLAVSEVSTSAHCSFNVFPFSKNFISYIYCHMNLG